MGKLGNAQTADFSRFWHPEVVRGEGTFLMRFMSIKSIGNAMQAQAQALTGFIMEFSGITRITEIYTPLESPRSYESNGGTPIHVCALYKDIHNLPGFCFYKIGDT